MEELSKPAVAADATPKEDAIKTQASKHHPILVKMICDQLALAPDQLLDFELSLADAAPAGKLIVIICKDLGPIYISLFPSFCTPLLSFFSSPSSPFSFAPVPLNSISFVSLFSLPPSSLHIAWLERQRQRQRQMWRERHIQRQSQSQRQKQRQRVET